ncbi:MAG: biotin--[acetyl-CoA-carboxylase] ligase [Gallionella sp.]|nr:biotin--[acetyl-CoA-carboxylase] ligase [Gallionella sp.]
MGQRAWQLLDLLADGEFHSGDTLAQCLCVSRASVFNALTEAEAFGIALQRVHGRGYRLSQPWQRLDGQQICLALAEVAPRFQLEILQQATSSNALLLQRATQGAPSGSVLAVELQTAGRGRRGRIWHSGLGNALTFSVLWRFECGLNALSGLSLAVGVAIVRALQRFAARGVQLKWPNDVLTAHGKLGGVLIEAQGDMLGPCAVVIGIGVNCSLPLHLEQRIDQASSALDQVCGQMPGRNQLLAALLQELARVLDEFAQRGFANLRAEWESHHARQDAAISLHLPDGSVVTGIARGVSDTGELRVETAQGLCRFNSGEVGE